MRPLDGQTNGLKASQLKRLQATFRRKVKGDTLVTHELARYLCDLSFEIGRLVGVLIDRTGEITNVIVGDPSGSIFRTSDARAVVLRAYVASALVRTELRQHGLTREDLADLGKLRLDAVAVVEIDPNGQPKTAHWAYLLPDELRRTVSPTQETVRTPQDLPENAMALVRDAEAEMSRMFAATAKEVVRDEAMLVGVWTSDPGARKKAQDSMAELRELARTAEVKVVDATIQIRREVDPRTVVGRGKIEELTLRALELGADMLIFDRDLSPSQLRAITNETDLKVIDRTQLILDIFARHAKSRDGKLQVELAQLKYALPRLIEKSTMMSRLTGGIGGQGPGETKLEIHRRRARDRIHRLEQEIEKLSVQRVVRRKQRSENRIPVVSIVGYTNAGKSTLLNALTNSHVLAEDKLFATLDPTTRRLRFPEEREIILTDTVGFIRDLPKDLVAAFRATLEELADSELLLHVVDASDPLFDQKRQAVEEILGQLDVLSVPRLIVLNKADSTPRPLVSALKRVTGGTAVSAMDRTGLDILMLRIEDTLFGNRRARAEAEEASRMEVIPRSQDGESGAKERALELEPPEPVTLEAG